MNNQEAFDIVVNHLLTQKTKSQLNGFCQYRGPNGLKCAIGILIPEDEYQISFERLIVTSIIEKVPSIQKLNPGFLARLQLIHDHYDISSWERRLKGVADDYNLEWNYGL